jgi:hypothetical protein
MLDPQVEGGGQTKINNGGLVGFEIDKNITTVDVSVDDVLLVQKPQGVGNVDRHLEKINQGPFLLHKCLPEVQTANVGQHQGRFAFTLLFVQQQIGCAFISKKQRLC